MPSPGFYWGRVLLGWGAPKTRLQHWYTPLSTPLWSTEGRFEGLPGGRGARYLFPVLPPRRRRLGASPPSEGVHALENTNALKTTNALTKKNLPLKH